MPVCTGKFPARRKSLLPGEKVAARKGWLMWGLSFFRAVRTSHRVPSTPGPFGGTLCKQERA